jgi:phosphoenolpyruvate carboxylase
VGNVVFLQTLLGLSKAFSQFLTLSNAAENHHRVRRLRERLLGSQYGMTTKPDSTIGVIIKLLKDDFCNAETMMKSLCQQRIEIVLTAHPTEVNRRTLLQKYQRIDKILADRDRTDLTMYERKQLDDSLTREILSIWRSDLLRRKKPTPEKEAISGMA